MSAYADVEHTFTQPLDNPEAIYNAPMDMRILNQEVLRTVLLNTRYRRITTVDISKGTISESVAHPREIFRPAIVYSAYAFVVVHNLCVATHRLCYVECGSLCCVPGKYLYASPFSRPV